MPENTLEIRVPTLPEAVADAQLISWQKHEGEQVSRDENLVEIETDKVVLEVPAPDSGVLKKIIKQSGSTVNSEELIALIDTTDAATQPVTGPVKAAKSENYKAEQNNSIRAENKTAATPDSINSGNIPQGPAARRLVNEHDLDARKIRATGRGGRLTKGDVVEFLEIQRTKPSSNSIPAAQSSPQIQETPSTDSPARGGERREKMTRLRARIAERLVEAQQTSAILTTFNEVDMQAVISVRKRLKDEFEQRHGTRLGFMSFFIKACVEALQRFPMINAAVEGDEIVYHDYYDIGVAVGSPRGLVVPVLRDADHADFASIESQIRSFGTKAQEGRLSMDDLTGGTFSITNGGVFGSMLSTPILNPPQSAILGMHKIQQRAVVVDGEIVARPMMYLALSYDHRIVDGREAVSFLVAVKESLEDPDRLLLNL